MGKDHLNKRTAVAPAKEEEHGEIPDVQAKPGRAQIMLRVEPMVDQY